MPRITRAIDNQPRRGPAIGALRLTGSYGATYPGSVSEDYGYDWVGNRKNPPASSNAMVFNKVDQLTSRPANSERTWTYDNLGNLYQIAEPDSVILKDFSYFGSGLLNRAQFDKLSQYPRHIDNYWDGDANRVQIDYWNGDDTYTYTYVYDVTAGIPAVVKEITPSTTVYYYREPGGELLARQEGTTGSTRRPIRAVRRDATITSMVSARRVF